MKTPISKYIYIILAFLLGIAIGYTIQLQKLDNLKQETIVTNLAYSLGILNMIENDIQISKKLIAYAIVPSIEDIGTYKIKTNNLQWICQRWDNNLLKQLEDLNSTFIYNSIHDTPFKLGIEKINNQCLKLRGDANATKNPTSK